MSLRASPLAALHLAAGARMGEFGGASMPLEYPGGGVLREHAAVREAVGLFDVSHLGKATVRGPGAAALINSCLTNDLTRIGPGRAQYTMCCEPDTAGIVDDLIVYLHSDDEVLIVPNAANTSEVLDRLRAAAPPGIEVRDERASWAVLAVQGPRAAEVLEAVGLTSELGYMSFIRLAGGMSICRSGYTGERGYELLVGVDAAAEVFSALLAEVTRRGGLPCGLAARDTLRTEMGYPLHGQDLTRQITPLQARAGWAVGWAKPAFWGRAALLAERERGPTRLLRGLRLAGRAIPRPGMSVRDAAGRPAGTVTSGTFSPTLRAGIALALLDAAVPEDAQVTVDVRGQPAPARVLRPPFVDRSPT